MADPPKANKTQLLNPDFAEQLICQNPNQIYSGTRIAVSVMMIILMVTMTIGWSSRANHFQLPNKKIISTLVTKGRSDRH